MAGDRKRFNRALRKWDQLRSRAELSVAADLGTVAVLCSYWKYQEKGKEWTESEEKLHRKDIKNFRKEALKIADIAMAAGRSVEVSLNTRKTDMDQALQNPSISDVVLVGNGNLSNFFLPDHTYDWEDVSLEADHLKQGNFTQRHCGGFAYELPVPLGMFAVSSFSDVYAPVGEGIEPRGLHHKDNQKINRVFEEYEVPDYDYIKQNFRY